VTTTTLNHSNFYILYRFSYLHNGGDRDFKFRRHTAVTGLRIVDLAYSCSATELPPTDKLAIAAAAADAGRHVKKSQNFPTPRVI